MTIVYSGPGFRRDLRFQQLFLMSAFFTSSATFIGTGLKRSDTIIHTTRLDKMTVYLNLEMFAVGRMPTKTKIRHKPDILHTEIVRQLIDPSVPSRIYLD